MWHASVCLKYVSKVLVDHLPCNENLCEVWLVNLEFLKTLTKHLASPAKQIVTGQQLVS